MNPNKYLGYRQEDYATPYAAFYQEHIAALSGPVSVALAAPSKHPLPAFSEAARLSEAGYQAVETGFSLERDGSIRVAVLTHMPGVAPAMWDWWFGWHGSSANRYKLWHPKAHVDAQWKDGRDDLAYIGRTSMIEEYIGPKLEKASIRFIAPAELGFPPVDQQQEVYICARVGYTHVPLDFGWLVHQIRSVEGGAEMRSRFWMGGEHIRWRSPGPLSGLLSYILRKIKRLPEQQARELLIHCSEEMNHLAAILPGIYAAMRGA